MANVSLWWKMDGLIKNVTRRKLDIHQSNISERLKFMIRTVLHRMSQKSSTLVLATDTCELDSLKERVKIEVIE